jgi:hypothetical protein
MGGRRQWIAVPDRIVERAPRDRRRARSDLTAARLVRALLTSAGFSDIGVQGLREPMWFGTDAEDAHNFVVGLLGWMLHGLDHDRRDQALDDLRATVAAHDTGHGVLYQSGTWLIRATRTRR